MGSGRPARYRHLTPAAPWSRQLFLDTYAHPLPVSKTSLLIKKNPKTTSNRSETCFCFLSKRSIKTTERFCMEDIHLFHQCLCTTGCTFTTAPLAEWFLCNVGPLNESFLHQSVKSLLKPTYISRMRNIPRQGVTQLHALLFIFFLFVDAMHHIILSTCNFTIIFFPS